MKKTLALVLALMMMLALVACGGGAEEAAAPAEAAAAPAVEAAAPAEAAPEAPAAGEPSEEPTGEPVAELFPADGYAKDFEGYKAYAIDALKSDEHAPAEVVDMTVAAIEAAADVSSADFDMLISQGRILSYEEFIG